MYDINGLGAELKKIFKNFALSIVNYYWFFLLVLLQLLLTFKLKLFIVNLS